jgi:hypothetical protein
MKRLDAITGFAGRVTPSSTEYPGGSFKDKSSSSSNNGTPVSKQELLNEIWGAFLGILNKAGRTASGNTETAVASDVASAIFEDNAINGASALVAGSVGETQLSNSSVSENKIQNNSVSNSKLQSNIQLSKISGGTLSIGSGVDILGLNNYGMSIGDINAESMSLYKTGVRFFSNGAPGELTYHFRAAIYDIKSNMAAASTSITTTATEESHQHNTGTKYSFSPAIETNIPNTTNIIGSSVSYTRAGTSGAQKICSIPFGVNALKGGTTLSITDIMLNTVITSSEVWAVDTAYPVIFTIYHDGATL